MRTLDAAKVRTRAPLELVNWTNEEGSRFRPAMMGSRVHACDMMLEDALAITDDKGISVREALRSSGQAGPLAPAPRGWACWLEAHIEQGPVMEATGTDIGIVTGTVHARYFQLTVTGDPSHVGPTTMDRRRDSLAATAEIILAIERIAHAAEPSGRASATWIENFPNARGNVANITRLHCDVRHEHAERAIAMEHELRDMLNGISKRRRVTIDVDAYATFGPISFDPTIGAVLRQKAEARQLATQVMIAAAGHDSGADREAVPECDAVRSECRWHHPQSARILDAGAGGARRPGAARCRAGTGGVGFAHARHAARSAAPAAPTSCRRGARAGSGPGADPRARLRRVPHRPARGRRRTRAGQSCRWCRATRSSAALRHSARTWTGSASAIASACRGWAGPAAYANSADLDGRICARRRASPATRSMAATPTTPWPTSASASRSHPASATRKRRRCCVPA